MADQQEPTTPAIVNTSRLPIDIVMTIFESLCPAPPSSWIHKLGGDTRAKELISSVSHREYNVSMQTMLNVSKTCSWARGFMERYLYRYVVLSTGAQLAGFAAALHGRFQCGSEKEHGEKLAGYVRGLYCLVDMTDPQDLMGWFTFEKQLYEWKKSLKGVPKENNEFDNDLEHQGIPVTSGDWIPELHGLDISLNDTDEEPQAPGEQDDKAYRRFLRTYSAPHDPCAAYEGGDRPDPLNFSENMFKGNLYNLFLKTLYALPNVSDLLCSWYCVQRAAGFLPSNVEDYPGPWVAPRPETLHKIKTCTLRVLKDGSLEGGLPEGLGGWDLGALDSSTNPLRRRDTHCSLRAVMEAFPSLESLDATAMEDVTGPTAPPVLYLGLGDMQDWGDGPWLEGQYRQGFRRFRRGRGIDHIPGGWIDNRTCAHGSEMNPIRHVRIYNGFLKDTDIAAFCKVAPGLETLLVRFKAPNWGGPVIHDPQTLPSLDDGLLACRDSLRYLELLSCAWNHYLSKTPDTLDSRHLRRLTCLSQLHKLETLVVDFNGLFGEFPMPEFLGDQDLDILPACLPPRLVTLKVACVWSSSGYVVYSREVAMFLEAVRRFYEAGMLPLADTLTSFVVVAPRQFKRKTSSDATLGRALKATREYFSRTKVVFSFEE